MTLKEFKNYICSKQDVVIAIGDYSYYNTIVNVNVNNIDLLKEEILNRKVTGTSVEDNSIVIVLKEEKEDKYEI